MNQFDMSKFDLLEYQREARSRKLPSALFHLWEDVCRHYDRGTISSYELDEMKAIIWPNLSALTQLRKVIEASFNKQAAA